MAVPQEENEKKRPTSRSSGTIPPEAKNVAKNILMVVFIVVILGVIIAGSV